MSNFVVTTLAGSGKQGNLDGDVLKEASFNNPGEFCCINETTILLCDTENQCLRLLDIVSGIVSTLDTEPFGIPRSPIVIDGGNAIVIADEEKNNIRMIQLLPQEEGQYEVYNVVIAGGGIAGGGIAGYRDGPAEQALFNRPRGLYAMPDGSILVAEAGNHTIRRIAGDDSRPGLFVQTIAGTGVPGFVDGTLQTARFSSPTSVTMDRDGTVLAADTGNHAIRALHPPIDGNLSSSTWFVTTLAGDGVPGFANDMVQDVKEFRSIFAINAQPCLQQPLLSKFHMQPVALSRAESLPFYHPLLNAPDAHLLAAGQYAQFSSPQCVSVPPTPLQIEMTHYRRDSHDDSLFSASTVVAQTNIPEPLLIADTENNCIRALVPGINLGPFGGAYRIDSNGTVTTIPLPNFYITGSPRTRYTVDTEIETGTLGAPILQDAIAVVLHLGSAICGGVCKRVIVCSPALLGMPAPQGNTSPAAVVDSKEAAKVIEFLAKQGALGGGDTCSFGVASPANATFAQSSAQGLGSIALPVQAQGDVQPIFHTGVGANTENTHILCHPNPLAIASVHLKYARSVTVSGTTPESIRSSLRSRDINIGPVWNVPCTVFQNVHLSIAECLQGNNALQKHYAPSAGSVLARYSSPPSQTAVVALANRDITDVEIGLHLLLGRQRGRALSSAALVTELSYHAPYLNSIFSTSAKFSKPVFIQSLYPLLDSDVDLDDETTALQEEESDPAAMEKLISTPSGRRFLSRLRTVLCVSEKGNHLLRLCIPYTLLQEEKSRLSTQDKASLTPEDMAWSYFLHRSIPSEILDKFDTQTSFSSSLSTGAAAFPSSHTLSSSSPSTGMDATAKPDVTSRGTVGSQASQEKLSQEAIGMEQAATADQIRTGQDTTPPSVDMRESSLSPLARKTLAAAQPGTQIAHHGLYSPPSSAEGVYGFELPPSHDSPVFEDEARSLSPIVPAPLGQELGTNVKDEVVQGGGMHVSHVDVETKLRVEQTDQQLGGAREGSVASDSRAEVPGAAKGGEEEEDKLRSSQTLWDAVAPRYSPQGLSTAKSKSSSVPRNDNVPGTTSTRRPIIKSRKQPELDETGSTLGSVGGSTMSSFGGSSTLNSAASRTSRSSRASGMRSTVQKLIGGESTMQDSLSESAKRRIELATAQLLKEHAVGSDDEEESAHGNRLAGKSLRGGQRALEGRFTKARDSNRLAPLYEATEKSDASELQGHRHQLAYEAEVEGEESYDETNGYQRQEYDQAPTTENMSMSGATKQFPRQHLDTMDSPHTSVSFTLLSESQTVHSQLSTVQALSTSFSRLKNVPHGSSQTSGAAAEGDADYSQYLQSITGSETGAGKSRRAANLSVRFSNDTLPLNQSLAYTNMPEPEVTADGLIAGEKTATSLQNLYHAITTHTSKTPSSVTNKCPDPLSARLLAASVLAVSEHHRNELLTVPEKLAASSASTKTGLLPPAMASETIRSAHPVYRSLHSTIDSFYGSPFLQTNQLSTSATVPNASFLAENRDLSKSVLESTYATNVSIPGAKTVSSQIFDTFAKQLHLNYPAATSSSTATAQLTSDLIRVSILDPKTLVSATSSLITNIVGMDNNDLYSTVQQGKKYGPYGVFGSTLPQTMDSILRPGQVNKTLSGTQVQSFSKLEKEYLTKQMCRSLFRLGRQTVIGNFLSTVPATAVTKKRVIRLEPGHGYGRGYSSRNAKAAAEADPLGPILRVLLASDTAGMDAVTKKGVREATQGQKENLSNTFLEQSHKLVSNPEGVAPGGGGGDVQHESSTLAATAAETPSLLTGLSKSGLPNPILPTTTPATTAPPSLIAARYTWHTQASAAYARAQGQVVVPTVPAFVNVSTAVRRKVGGTVGSTVTEALLNTQALAESTELGDRGTSTIFGSDGGMEPMETSLGFGSQGPQSATQRTAAATAENTLVPSSISAPPPAVPPSNSTAASNIEPVPITRSRRGSINRSQGLLPLPATAAKEMSQGTRSSRARSIVSQSRNTAATSHVERNQESARVYREEMEVKEVLERSFDEISEDSIQGSDSMRSETIAHHHRNPVEYDNEEYPYASHDAYVPASAQFETASFDPLWDRSLPSYSDSPGFSTSYSQLRHRHRRGLSEEDVVDYAYGRVRGGKYQNVPPDLHASPRNWSGRIVPNENTVTKPRREGSLPSLDETLPPAFSVIVNAMKKQNTGVTLSSTAKPLAQSNIPRSIRDSSKHAHNLSATGKSIQHSLGQRMSQDFDASFASAQGSRAVSQTSRQTSRRSSIVSHNSQGGKPLREDTSYLHAQSNGGNQDAFVQSQPNASELDLMTLQAELSTIAELLQKEQAPSGSPMKPQDNVPPETPILRPAEYSYNTSLSDAKNLGYWDDTLSVSMLSRSYNVPSEPGLRKAAGSAAPSSTGRERSSHNTVEQGTGNRFAQRQMRRASLTPASGSRTREQNARSAKNEPLIAHSGRALARRMY